MTASGLHILDYVGLDYVIGRSLPGKITLYVT